MGSGDPYYMTIELYSNKLKRPWKGGGNEKVRSEETTNKILLNKGGDNKLKFRHLLLTFFIILIITSLMPNAILAEETDKDSYKLYQVIETIQLDGLSLLEKTYLYGIEHENEIQIQYADTNRSIPSTFVEEVNDLGSAPTFFSETKGQKQTIVKDTQLYFDSTHQLKINTDMEYPVFVNEQGLQVIYLGNIQFLLNKKEIHQGESDESTNSDPENSDEEPEEILEENSEGASEEKNMDPPIDSDSSAEEIPETEFNDDSEENLKETELKEVNKVKNNNIKKNAGSVTSIQQVDPWKGVSSKYFKVTTDNLVIYDNRSGSLKPIGKLTKGQVYPRVSDFGNWHRIQFGDIYGYVRKRDTVPDSGSVLKNKNTTYKNQSRSFKALKDLIVYDNTSGKLVPYGIIDKGQSYPVATEYGNWWRVVYADRVGYVRKSEVALPFTKNDKYFKVIKNTIVYDNRTGSLVKVGELQQGQVYPRISDYGNWHRIQFGDIYGYIRKSDTIPDNGSTLKNQNTTFNNKSHSFKALQDLVVYDNTSGSLVPFGIIDKKQTYPIATDYGNWWRVIFSDRVGYVRKSDVETLFTKSDQYFKAEENIPVYDNRTGKLVKVGELRKGQVYPRVSDYGNWHRIQFGNIYGYIRKSGTSYASGNEIKNINTAYKNQSRTFTALEPVTVYDNTSGSLVQFGTIDKGSIFPIATDYGNWWRIVYADRVGYISKDQVKVQTRADDKYFRAIKNTAVYDNRSGSLKKVGEVLKGQAYSINRDYGNWWRVQFGDIYGYVKKSDTGYATKNEIKNLNQKYNHTIGDLVTKQKVTIYDNSSGSLVAFGELEDKVSYSITSDYGNWWRIVYLDRVGYIRKNEVQAQPNKSIKIFIDPGHGGSDPGADGFNLIEKDLTLDISKRLSKYLNQYAGIEIKMSRSTDKTVSLSERTKMANNWGADYFVSVHINSCCGATGFESYVHNGNRGTKDAKEKQKIIHDHIAKNIDVRDRGIKSANFHVLRESNMPAILLEYLFISTKEDNDKLKSNSYRDKLARLTAEGIAKAFKLKRK